MKISVCTFLFGFSFMDLFCPLMLYTSPGQFNVSQEDSRNKTGLKSSFSQQIIIFVLGFSAGGSVQYSHRINLKLDLGGRGTYYSFQAGFQCNNVAFM